ncbi:MAG TPA: PIN domain-containing protein [Candidatus Limnocylindrales bacterium]
MKGGTTDFGIAVGATLLVDTSAVLAYLSGAEPTSAAAASILDGMVASGRNAAAISAVTVTESLVRPYRAGSDQAVALVEAFLQHFSNLRVEPVTFAVGRTAARIRATTSAPTPDALILATGVVAGASVAVANDGRWDSIIKRAKLPIALVRLDAIAATGLAT